jgi:hydrogenase maturation protein HypF
MKLEFQIQSNVNDSYEFEIKKNEKLIVDWTKIITGLIKDLEAKIDKGILSAKFHNSLVEIIVQVAQLVKVNKVLLSGGCFQNIYLLNHTTKRLKEEGFQPYWHQRIPTNDGGISPGQIAAYNLKEKDFKF